MTGKQAISSLQVFQSAEEIWRTNLKPAGCEICKRVFLIPATWECKNCPGCAQGELKEQPARLRTEPPELLVPFEVDLIQAQTILKKYIEPLWFKPEDLTIQNLQQRMLPVFLPMWLVDGDIHGVWQGEAGFDYQVKSSQEIYKGGTWQTIEKIESRRRWEPRIGTLERHYNNVVIPALESHQKLIQQLGDYQLEKANSYQPSELKDAAVQVPDLNPENAMPFVQNGFNYLAEQECLKATNAIQIRNFSIQATYTNLHWTQLLLPVYATYYMDDDHQPHPIWINGQSGKASGVRLASQRKGWQWAGILAVTTVLLFIVGTVATLIPSLLPLGIAFYLLAILSTLVTVILAIWPWQWNRAQNIQEEQQ